jgi:hypothetical protein
MGGPKPPRSLYISGLTTPHTRGGLRPPVAGEEYRTALREPLRCGRWCLRTVWCKSVGWSPRCVWSLVRSTGPRSASFARFAVVAGAFARSGTRVGWSPRCVWSLVRSTGPRSASFARFAVVAGAFRTVWYKGRLVAALASAGSFVVSRNRTATTIHLWHSRSRLPYADPCSKLMLLHSRKVIYGILRLPRWHLVCHR